MKTIATMSAFAGLLFLQMTVKADGINQPRNTLDTGAVTSGTRIKRIQDLPPAVQQGFKNSKYGDWYVRNIHELERNGQQLVSIVVSQVTDYQMGALYKDQYRLYFSMDGKLIRTRKVS